MSGTHTYATLEVSAAAYDEIAAKLRAAEYHHSFVDDAIDMHGIGLTKGPAMPVLKRDELMRIRQLLHNRSAETIKEAPLAAEADKELVNRLGLMILAL